MHPRTTNRSFTSILLVPSESTWKTCRNLYTQSASIYTPAHKLCTIAGIVSSESPPKCNSAKRFLSHERSRVNGMCSGAVTPSAHTGSKPVAIPLTIVIKDKMIFLEISRENRHSWHKTVRQRRWGTKRGTTCRYTYLFAKRVDCIELEIMARTMLDRLDVSLGDIRTRKTRSNSKMLRSLYMVTFRARFDRTEDATYGSSLLSYLYGVPPS